MPNLNILTFAEALEASNEGERHVLLGNGFSIAQTQGEFSYSNLLEISDLETEDPIRKVFDELETFDFEEVIFALEHASQIEEAYDDDEKAVLFHEDARRLREALITAVRIAHPAIQFDVPIEQFRACANFLGNFSNVFTLNYDLLLYWVILNTEPRIHSDGFGRGNPVEGFRTFRDDANCSVFYLHGALHLFQNRINGTKKRLLTNNTLLTSIEDIIRNRQNLPLFVTEGTAIKKKAKINSVPYLRHCLDELGKKEGSLFIFGHSASIQDKHIYNAIFSGQFRRLFICVHNPNENLITLKENLAPFSVRVPRVEIEYVDAATVGIWGSDG